MNDQDTIGRLRQQGVQAETVGEILGDELGQAGTTPARFVPPALEGTPPLPAPGIYFGMSDEVYHSLPALNVTGIKRLAASPMIYWAGTPWLSERKRKEVEQAKAGGEKEHFVFGKAYHCRIMEGVSAYALRYAVELDPADFPDVLISTAQIKAAIGRHMKTQPVTPRGGKDALIVQLEGLVSGSCLEGGVFDTGEKITVDALKERIGRFEVEAPVKPVSKVLDVMPDTGEEYMRDAVKADWIKQLLELDPEAQIFDDLAERHRAEHPGKVFLTLDQHAELEIAARMVERDPELHKAFRGGHAEVTLIWYCPRTGVPMKCRVDYLKIKAMVDLKSIGNQRERSIENAIRFEIASYKYNIQPAVYFEGAEVVRQLVREHGASVVHVMPEPEETEDFNQLPIDEQDRRMEIVTWALKWAAHREPDEWLWVFQQKGPAPITRGVWFPRGTTLMLSQDIVLAAKKRFIEYSREFGTDPWLDVKPSYIIADEEIPQSATEI